MRDIKLIGTSTSAGGQFRDVRITGEAELKGDTSCRNLSCTGNVRIAGSLQAESVRLTGECEVDGGLQVHRLRTVGELRVGQNVRGEKLKVTGELRAGGHCEAESLELHGSVQVDASLNAERLSVRLHGPSRAREIGGGHLEIRRSRSHLLKAMLGQGATTKLTADLIEGDTLFLEHTHAAVVRGNRVTLGTGCVVGRVEYRDDLKVGGKAEVRERAKL
jgi:cytoskeletal protein CcmA (bactofilin family)